MTGADMTDDEIMHVVSYSTVGSSAIAPTEWCAFARALLARQPAAIDKQEAVAWPYEITRGHIECLIADHQRDGQKQLASRLNSSGSYLIRVAESFRWCLEQIDAAPLANEASKPDASEGRKPELLYGPCQNVCWTQDMVPREERIDAVVISHTDYERLLAAPHAAPSVEQDERGVFAEYRRGVKEAFHIANMIHANRQGRTAEETCSSIVRVLAEMVNSGEARAASTSANVAQLQSVDLPPRVIDQLYQAAGVSTYHPDGDQQEKLHAFARNVVAETLARLPTANVAQGAVAVATVKVYETYTGQNGWTEVTQEEYDRTKDKYEHRIRRVPAPPAQTALTDAARDVLGERQRQVTAERWTPEHDDAHEIGELARAAACYAANATGYRLQSRINIWPWNREWWKPTAPRRDLVKAGALILAEIERLDRRALTAAQSASGDTK